MIHRKRQFGRIGTTVGSSALFLYACGGGGGQSVAPVVVTPPTPPPAAKQFADATSASGIAHTFGYQNALDHQDVARLAGGAAIGDYDGDGDLDLFIIRGDIGGNLLYKNLGNLMFEDVADAAGVAFTRGPAENYRHSGPSFADMDGDGDLDLFIGGLNGDPSLLFSNNGDGTFTDVTAGSGIDGMNAYYTISSSFGDYDLDGDLDMFLSHWGTPRSYTAPGDTEHLWRNDSDVSGIRFTSVSESAGISPSILTIADPLVNQRVTDYTFSPTFARINDDSYPDILSVADFNFTQVFINNQDGTFSNATDTDVLIDGNGMGSAVADYDNDGDLDWFVSSIHANGDTFAELGVSLSQIGNRLYRNTNGVFEDVTFEAGVEAGGWGWGSCFFDFENDGDLDLYHTNGWPLSGSYGDFANDPSRAFVNDGSGRFTEQSADLGLADSDQGRGVICADLDNDGDIDILQLHRAVGQAATLWENTTSGNNSLTIELAGIAPNTQASGSRIFVSTSSGVQMREICIASNFVSHNSMVQLFGLGPAAQADEVRVEWNDGNVTVLNGVLSGQKLRIAHPNL